MRTRIRTTEWTTLAPSELPLLAGRELDAHQRSIALRLEHGGRLTIRELRNGLEITTTSFVGRVELGDLEITIHPKVPGRVLLDLFRYAYDPRAPMHIETTSFATDDTASFEDLLCAQLLSEAHDLLRGGLHRRYEPRREALESPRGRIDVQAIATRGITRAALPCRHHPRSEDTLVNRILRAGIGLASRTATDRRLRGELRHLERTLDVSVGRIVLSRHHLDRAERSMNRMLANYAPALRLIEILVDGTSPTLDDEHGPRNVRVPGFLFDMNLFFQRLLLRFLRDHTPDHEVIAERGLRGMMRYLPGWNPRKARDPTPAPDFALVRRGHVVAYLDAKYRDLWRRTLPRDMLYQLAVYAVSQPSAFATILYPAPNSAAREARIEIRTPGGDERTLGGVALRPVHLDRLRDAIASRERARCGELARELTLGTSS